MLRIKLKMKLTVDLYARERVVRTGENFRLFYWTFRHSKS